MRIEGFPHRQILPDKYDVGSSVNGYGGGAFVVDHEGHVVFVDGVTNSVNRADADGRDIVMLIGPSDTRFADLSPHPNSARFVLGVQEQKEPGKRHAVTSIVLIDTQSKTHKVIQSGADFYSHPRFSLDGRHICWLQWNFPHMQWTGAVLKVADFHDSTVSNARQIVEDIGVGQPRWGTGGTLFYASDKTGYQQLYAVSLRDNKSRWLHFSGLEQCEFAGAEFWLSRRVSTQSNLSIGWHG
jgi:hypothetical protein